MALFRRKTKRILLIFFGIFALFFGALVAAPFVFKDKITAFAKEEINNMLNAEVYFEEVGLTFLKNFPYATISLENFGVVGEGVFEGDTLAHGNSFQLVADIMSIVQGDEIRIRKVLLDQPKINVMVLADGTANYDIMKSGTAQAETSTPSDSAKTAPPALKIKLKEYRIANANVLFDDRTQDLKADIRNLTHRGKGNFTATIFDLITNTQADAVTVISEGVAYLNKTRLNADIGLNIDQGKSVYKLLKNSISLNELTIGIDGLVGMDGENIELDLAFDSRKTDFKSILSMIPGAYTKDFENVQTDGTLELNGFAKGTFNETTYPAFGINLKINDAWLQYPDLPKKVTGIQTDLSVSSPQASDFNDTKIDIRSFHADLGDNPVDIKAEITGLERMAVKGDMKARLNLDEITEMFPVEDTELHGDFEIDARAEGIYDEEAHTFPSVDASMKMVDGFIRNEEYPAELKNVQFEATLKNENGSMAETELDVSRFHLELDEEEINGRANVKNFDDPDYDVAVGGSVDLEKILEIYPMEGMELAGKVFIDELVAKGKMSDVESENYTSLSNSGTVRVENLTYKDAELNYPVHISTAKASFTPQEISLSELKGTSGSSDFAATGNLRDYMAYALLEEGTLAGSLDLISNKFDLNEWMVEAPPLPAAPPSPKDGPPKPPPPLPDSLPLSVVPVPDNINMLINADLKEVLYDNMDMKNLMGTLKIAEETVNMENVTFNTLGGNFKMDGSYNTSNIREPLYQMDLDIRNLGIQEAFETFNTVQSFAPVAQFISGVASSTFSMKGTLGKDMMPDLEDLYGFGKVEILRGKLLDFPVMTQLVEKTKLNNLKEINMENIRTQFEIKDGSLIVKPFAFEHKGITLKVGGKQNLIGKLDYDIELDAPSGKIGESATSALSGLVGSPIKTSDRMNVKLKVKGFFFDPKIGSFKSNTVDEVGGQLVDVAEDKIEQQLDQQLGVEVDIDSVRNQVSETTQQFKDTVQAKVDEVKQQAKDSIKNTVNNVLENNLGEETKDKIDNVKNLFGWPKKKDKDKK